MGPTAAQGKGRAPESKKAAGEKSSFLREWRNTGSPWIGTPVRPKRSPCLVWVACVIDQCLPMRCPCTSVNTSRRSACCLSCRVNQPHGSLFPKSSNPTPPRRKHVSDAVALAGAALDSRCARRRGRIWQGTNRRVAAGLAVGIRQ
jgi:hypothetical protein